MPLLLELDAADLPLTGGDGSPSDPSDCEPILSVSRAGWLFPHMLSSSTDSQRELIFVLCRDVLILSTSDPLPLFLPFFAFLALSAFMSTFSSFQILAALLMSPEPSESVNPLLFQTHELQVSSDPS